MLLPVLFFFIACLYSAAGFGGGSSYLALLLLFDQPLAIVPLVALACNITVTAGGCFHFAKARHLNLALALPFLMTSVPMAYMGGLTPIAPRTYLMMLAPCLLLSGLRLLSMPREQTESQKLNTPNPFYALLIGSALGYLSGLIGIGGGIFLSPILYFLNWGRPKTIAATCALFILINSLSGIIGQVQKLDNSLHIATSYWPHILFVLVGGQIGSFLGSQKLPQRLIVRISGMLIVAVAVRILLKLL